MALLSLTTPQRVQRYAGLQTTNADDVIDGLVKAASASIRRHLGHDVTSQAYLETRDGDGSPRLFLREATGRRPVTAVSVLTVDGIPIPQRLSATGSGWALSGSVLALQGYRFARGFANVVVGYTAGFAEVPDDIAQAATEWVAFELKRRDRVGLRSQVSGQGETVSYELTDVPDFVRSRISGYVKVAPV